MTPAPPPGNTHSSPSEDYWAQMDLAGARQAVNLVNGVIVDGLGHVSLDSGPPSHAHQQPNIHQGSIPATGRRDKANSSSPAPPTSSATSLPFNQLIGGAVSDVSNAAYSGTPEPYRREKGSGKIKCVTLEANARSVHFLGQEESEPF